MSSTNKNVMTNAPVGMNTDQLWTLKDFCSWAQIPMSGGRSLVSQEKVPVVRIGRRLRLVPEAAKAAFLQSQK